MATERRGNRLLHETSPYLRQHAFNPVDWYAWGPEALERARRENQPIFLSIGYSACHWCHVMEHESFMDDETARLLNEHFVNIKVDREERPDLDQIYMNAVMLYSRGHGGWPMSVFLTPELQPFYAGTYFPPDDRYGGQMPSFQRLLQNIIQLWQDRRDELHKNAQEVTSELQRMGRIESGGGPLNEELLHNAAQMLDRGFDSTYGGFGNAPKFPHSMEMKLLLRVWRRFGDEDALAKVRVTLDHMAMGGIYDQLAGGFHRYSTDRYWLVPHFEKMLYDNALLCQVYLEAFQATGEPFYREVVEETLAWVRDEMTSPEGAFYSTLDADSEGVEGKFYVWTPREIESALGPELAEVFSQVYDVTETGNWEGHNILHRSKTYAQDAQLLKMPEPELRAKLTEAKRILRGIRSKRIWPGRDEKVVTSWNGLMIAAFAQAAQVLDPSWAGPAQRAADFALTRMRQSDRRLFRTYGAGSPPKLNGYSEDYAFLIDALVSLYEADFNARWITSAVELADVLVEQFWDDEGGGFFFTGKDHETLIVRSKDPHDGSIPSGNSMAATALLRLSKLTGRRDFDQKAIRTLRLFREQMAGSPTASGQMLTALDFHLGPVQEFAVVAPRSSPETRAALRTIQAGFRPNKVVAWSDTEAADDVNGPVALLGDKPAKEGAVTTYVCENFACQAPIVGLDALRHKLTAGPTCPVYSPQTSPSTSSET